MALGRVVVVLALVAALAGCRGPDGEEPPEGLTAAAWSARATEAFAGFAGPAQAFPAKAAAWAAGPEGDAGFPAVIAETEEAFAATLARVEALPPFPGDARPAALDTATARLYLIHVRLYRAGLALAPGVERVQLDLSARRLRTLGDRLFDQGQSVVERVVPTSIPANVEIRRPAEVPDWVTEGMAAGPPLDDPPGPRASSPPLAPATRPTQPAPSWERQADAAPTAADLRAGTDARELARRFTAAAAQLEAAPDPAGRDGRSRSALFRLRLLLLAEAARLRQLAALAGVDPAPFSALEDEVVAVAGLLPIS